MARKKNPPKLAAKKTPTTGLFAAKTPIKRKRGDSSPIIHIDECGFYAPSHTPSPDNTPEPPLEIIVPPVPAEKPTTLIRISSKLFIEVHSNKYEPGSIHYDLGRIVFKQQPQSCSEMPFTFDLWGMQAPSLMFTMLGDLRYLDGYSIGELERVTTDAIVAYFNRTYPELIPAFYFVFLDATAIFRLIDDAVRQFGPRPLDTPEVP